MKLQLTDHDIFLLKLAGSALILFVMLRFFLMPGLVRLQERGIQSGELSEKIEEMEASIENIPMLERALEERTAELERVSGTYYERMENRQVDELLTGLALKHGLFPVSLMIEGASAAIPEPYLYGSADHAAGPVSDTYMLTAAGRMVLNGEETKLFAFLSDIEENYPAVSLRSLSMTERVYFDADWNRSERPDMNCELAVYMYDPAAAQQAPPAAQTEESEEELLTGGDTSE